MRRWRAAQQALAAGAVVAIKGIGGYHLACRVDDEAAVAALRTRKARGAKPFAMLVRDLDVARRYAHIDDTEAAVLSSVARPIVLLRRHRDAPVADAVAPGSPLVGLMLPYSPIHHLLLAPVPGVEAPVPDALVLTSANRSDDPICFTEDDAVQRLPPLCDAVLDHDRPIHVPCDDSVVRVVDDGGAADPPVPRIRATARGPRPRRPAGAGGRRRTEEHLLPDRRCTRIPVRAHRRHGDAGNPAGIRACGRPTQRNPAPASSDWPLTCILDTTPAVGQSAAWAIDHWIWFSTTTRTWCRCWPSTGASANPSSGSRSTAPATAAIKQSGAARFSSSGVTATVSSGSATCCRYRCRAVTRPYEIRGGWRCLSCGWPVSIGRRICRRSPRPRR